MQMQMQKQVQNHIQIQKHIHIHTATAIDTDTDTDPDADAEAQADANADAEADADTDTGTSAIEDTYKAQSQLVRVLCWDNFILYDLIYQPYDHLSYTTMLLRIILDYVVQYHMALCRQNSILQQLLLLIASSLIL